MLAYYDLRAMTLSMIMGIGIVAAALWCHGAHPVQPSHPDLAGLAAPADADDVMPSFDGAEIMSLDGR